MAESSGVNVGSGCEEKGPEELSQESARPGTTISRVKLFDTMVDTFLQKLVAAGSYQRFTDCYKCFYQLQPEMTQRIYDKFVTQLQTSIQEEISEIKAEGNLEAVLNALDAIVEESKDCKEPAWRPSGIPEKDLRSAVVPYFLQQRDALQRRVQKQEAENRQLADAVLAGRRQVEELQLQGQARQQAWQALHREQKELVAVLREPE
ncbi:polyamine-modulated factor 1 isoform X4 [Balaenoptera ricei]|uniref:Polyamine-modulated factor 1 isoform X4 n=2 Tax=Balaenoptera TaxID=9766 RepID=A0A8C0HVA6_BALMU|nr:polyamine-modulated factor 1 isoform X5 [Balaenoptera acutorostrata]XP_036713528.1 polyamine-modulated factor 1 isoform X4 [Balaenoptera musculus]XP_059789782.1 polyamine-modulated factor 1 isoform X4 [Balaenoptera ricei]